MLRTSIAIASEKVFVDKKCIVWSVDIKDRF